MLNASSVGAQRLPQAQAQVHNADAVDRGEAAVACIAGVHDGGVWAVRHVCRSYIGRVVVPCVSDRVRPRPRFCFPVNDFLFVRAYHSHGHTEQTRSHAQSYW